MLETVCEVFCYFNLQQSLNMKIRAIVIDVIDAERFDSFSSVITNCKNKYCCFNKKLNNCFIKS